MKTIDKFLSDALADRGERFFSKFPNDCGDCNVCCVAPAIDDGAAIIPEKPAGDTCKHCSATGCSIYKKRPRLCKEYACLYLCGLVEERPDSNGVAWSFQPHPVRGGRLLVMGHCMDAVAISKDSVAVATMQRFFSESEAVTCVALRDGKNAICYLKSGESQIVDIDPRDPLRLDLKLGSERDYPPLPPKGGNS